MGEMQQPRDIHEKLIFYNTSEFELDVCSSLNRLRICCDRVIRTVNSDLPVDGTLIGTKIKTAVVPMWYGIRS